MRQIADDLWETREDAPFPGLRTHAYLWTGAPGGNVLFYSTLTDAEFDRIGELGGIAHQYLSHRDEAGPTLARIADRFGAQLHAPAIELADIGRHAHVDTPLAGRHTDRNGIEVVPTPGHTPGSTSYVVVASDGRRYLFTGDTLFVGDDGAWAAGYLPPMSDAATLLDSLDLLATIEPDVVISSAFPGAGAVHELNDRPWPECVEQARSRLSARVS